MRMAGGVGCMQVAEAARIRTDEVAVCNPIEGNSGLAQLQGLRPLM